MKNSNISSFFVLSTILFGIMLTSPSNVLAHCDGIDGPVVRAARQALETGNVNLVLIWVQKEDEATVRIAFEKTLAVRKLSPEAKELSEMYFFETVVRIHRAGEGVQYTGLKAAGRDLGPAIPAADIALETGVVEPLLKLLTATMQEGVHEQFANARAKRNFSRDDLVAGRAYVEAYVLFIHFVERLYESTKTPPEGHSHESQEVGMHEQGH